MNKERSNKLESLDRIVIPKHIRKNHHIIKGTLMASYINEEGDLVLKRYYRTCIFCGRSEQEETLTEVDGCYLCHNCMQELTTVG